MTYDEAIAFWFGRINYEVRSATPSDLKLERMRALLRLLGDPHRRLRVVHITGTKGKGSTSAMLAQVLQSSGYRVGLFTSPHLVHVEERIQVDREPITAAELVALMEQVKPAVQSLEHGPWHPPTFFEISTALGFLHFVHRRVDVAVLEVGLGGRFDSTNVCMPMLNIITNIGLDHMAQLGNTISEIAYQKAGIIKPGVPVISGASQPEAQRMIRQVAQEQGARLVEMGTHFSVVRSKLPAIIQSAEREYTIPELGLLGKHQVENAALVLMACEELYKQGLHLTDPQIQRGLAEVRWPARIEVIERQPIVILDAAHNVPSVLALAQTLRESFEELPRRKHLLFAVSSDKQYEEMLQILASEFDEVHFTVYANNPRCVPVDVLVESYKKLAVNQTCQVHSSAKEAYLQIHRELRAEDMLVVVGSVFLAGELRDLMRKAASIDKK